MPMITCKIFLITCKIFLSFSLGFGMKWSILVASPLTGIQPVAQQVVELQFTSTFDGVNSDGVMLIQGTKWVLFDLDIPDLREWSRLWASLPWLAVMCRDAELFKLDEDIWKTSDDDGTHSEPEPEMDATSRDQAFVTFGILFKANGRDSVAGDTTEDIWLTMADEEKSLYM